MRSTARVSSSSHRIRRKRRSARVSKRSASRIRASGFYSSWITSHHNICAYTRKRAHELGIDLIFLPVGSPHLNPIEPVWKSLKWESSPLIVEGAAEYRALLDDIFTELTDQLSFAGSWIENHLSGFIQKLR